MGMADVNKFQPGTAMKHTQRRFKQRKKREITTEALTPGSNLQLNTGMFALTRSIWIWVITKLSRWKFCLAKKHRTRTLRTMSFHMPMTMAKTCRHVHQMKKSINSLDLATYSTILSCWPNTSIKILTLLVKHCHIWSSYHILSNYWNMTC